MEFNFFESIFYGLMSGLAEFLPISAQAHRAILLKLFGMQSESYLLRFLIHCGVLLSVIISLRGKILQLSRENQINKQSKRRRRREPDQRSVLDLRIIKVAGVLTLLGFVIYYLTMQYQSNLLAIAGFLLINGIVLMIPRLLPSGNKDSRSMSALDSVLIGIAGALSMVPGVSIVSTTSTISLVRGADRQHALTWSLLLCIPVLIVMLGFDLYGIFAIGAGALSFVIFLQYIVAAAAAFTGGYFAIIFLRFLAVNTGFSMFAYYSWGAALFAFIFYLTI